MLDWLKANYGKLSAVALTALVAANAAFGFLSTDQLATVLAIAGAMGLHVVQSSHATMHAKLDALAEPFGDGPEDDDNPPPATYRAT